MGEVRQCVTLRLAPLIGNSLVTSSERNRLEGEEGDDLWIFQGKLDDSADLLIVNTVDNSRDRHNFHTGFMQVVDSLELHIKQVADFTVLVSGVANAVKLQVGVAQSGFSGLLAEIQALGELNAVGSSLHAVIAHLTGVAEGIEEVGRNCGLAAGELY